MRGHAGWIIVEAPLDGLHDLYRQKKNVAWCCLSWKDPYGRWMLSPTVLMRDGWLDGGFHMALFIYYTTKLIALMESSTCIAIKFQPNCLCFSLSKQRVLQGGLTVIVRWTERVVGHTPPRWEDDKVSNGYTGSCRFGGQHCKDWWILPGCWRGE